MAPRSAGWSKLAFAALALGLAGCVSVPIGDDRPELAAFRATAVAQVPLEVTPLLLGKARQPECGMVGDASCVHAVDMVHVAYVVKHPKATFLIDAGISSQIAADMQKFPVWLRTALNFEPVDSLGHALTVANVKPEFVILTHVHWDHTSGLTDLPGIKVVTDEKDLRYAEHFHGAHATVMPEHLKGTVPQVFKWDGPAYENFPASHDVFGDGSVVLVPLPGHTPGSLGVFLDDVHGKRLFFVGDAVWLRDGYRLPSHRPGPMAKLVDDNRADVSDTFWRLHHLAEKRPELVIVPAHDGEAYAEVKALSQLH